MSEKTDSVESGSAKINTESAIESLLDLVSYHVMNPGSKEQIVEDYPLTLRAIEQGHFAVIDGVPTFKLYEPIMTDSGALDHDHITFVTRIKPTEQERLSRGLNVQKQQVLLAMKMLAFMIGKSKSYLDKYSKNDYKTIQEIAQVFM